MLNDTKIQDTWRNLKKNDKIKDKNEIGKCRLGKGEIKYK